ncbi:MAG: helix-turn-helix domain-containing protein [Acidobacteria bacterium]|nr:helix-turn-helix domain-containing protein [Acidobacteriota bacterium]
MPPRAPAKPPDSPLPIEPRRIERCPYCGKDRAILTVKEATELATVNRKTISRWIRSGTLEHCVLPSGAVRIFKDSLIRIPGVPGEHDHSEGAGGTAKATPSRADAASPSRSKARRPLGRTSSQRR